MTGRIGVGDLYAGSSGIALALGVVSALVPDRSDFAAVARHALRRPIEPEAPWFDIGTAGQAYASALLGLVADDGELLQHASSSIATITPTIERNAELDLMNGWAGVLASFATVASITQNPAACDRTAELVDAFLAELDRQLACEARGPLRRRPGVAHGANGLALALDRAATLLGHDHAAACAQGLRNGALARLDEQPPTPEQPVLATWCWGELGMLHEAACATNVDAGRDTRGLTALLDHCVAVPHRLTHLCCGATGAALSLGVAAQSLNHAAAAEHSAGLFAALACRAVTAESMPNLRSSRFEDPGLLSGHAGVAYGLAWAARPDLVPDVLGFPLA